MSMHCPYCNYILEKILPQDKILNLLAVCAHHVWRRGAHCQREDRPQDDRGSIAVMAESIADPADYMLSDPEEISRSCDPSPTGNRWNRFSERV